MFTGLIEAVCRINSAMSRAGGIRLQIELNKDVKPGESVAVNGVCLTVSSIKGNMVEFDVSGQTLANTTLDSLKLGAFVNIERAMSPNDRFGGHFVQGHIDIVGKIKKIEKKGEFWQFSFDIPKEITGCLIPKGSIAVDGVSLTIADVQNQNFSAAIIPTTFENTIFKNYKTGDSVNIETDILCRIIKKQLENILPDKSNLTVDKLIDLGF
jgi:riboflavin synthase